MQELLNDVKCLGFRYVKIVVNDDLIEARGETEFISRLVDTLLDDFRGIGTTPLETAAQLRENGNANENTKFVLSHIGHLVDRTHDELACEAAEFGMIAAYDGMEVEFGKQKEEQK